LNYLAHAFLAEQDPDGLVGALLGDFVKGPLPGLWRPSLARAIALHRSIDGFTDAHPVTLRSRARFERPLRRYAGIVVDVFYDHVLARTWDDHSAEPLQAFSRRVYASAMGQFASLPEPMQRMVRRMVDEDWLTSYAEVAAVDRALQRIARRLSRENPLPRAIDALREVDAGLEADFSVFLPQLVAHVCDWKTRRAAPSATVGSIAANG